MNPDTHFLYLSKHLFIMRHLLFVLLLSSTSSLIAQANDTVVAELNSETYDTVDVFVVSKNSRFAELKWGGKSKYLFSYRDLKYIKEIRELIFEDADDAIKFFNTCQKALDTDKTYITHGYNVMRNRLSKNYLRLQNKEGGYTQISRDTFDDMKAAFMRTLE